MKKPNEAELMSRKIIPYLVSLGYPNQLIRTEIRTNQGRLADAVVYQNNDEPLIVIEVKRPDKTFPLRDETELRFDPSVRQVYLYAKELRAPYMLLSNGDVHYWFTTDSTGRPKLMDDPVRYLGSPETVQSPPNLEWLTAVFTRLRDFDRYSGVINIPTLLMAKLTSERENLPVEKAWFELESKLSRNNFSLSVLGRKNESQVVEAARIIDQLELNKYSNTDLLSAIDKIFINRQLRNTEFRIGRWLADFMVRLGHINEKSRIIDIACGIGDVLTAAKLAESRLASTATVGISKYPNAALWAMLQQDILGQKLENILILDPLTSNKDFQAFTHVIFAPPFGSRVQDSVARLDLFEYGIRNIEDLYLEIAIKLVENTNGRIVALVPEGMLFSRGRREYTRQYLMDKAQVSAVISLPSGALSPYSGIKSSVLVLDKKPLGESYNVFMAHVDSFSATDTFNANDVPQISEVLNSFDVWSHNRESIFPDNIWTKDSIELNPENFTINFYKSLTHDVESLQKYETVPLGDIAMFISRGRAIKLDERGNIPVVGPAAIRALDFDKDGIQKTNEENIPNNPVLIQNGDLLLNNIGTYLGQTVVADKELEGMYVSQHVMLIRANTELIDRVFLAIILNSDFVRTQIVSRATGTMMPSLTKASLESILIPLPNLSDQEMIAQRILEAKTKLVISRQETNKLENEFNDLLINPLLTGGDQ